MNYERKGRKEKGGSKRKGGREEGELGPRRMPSPPGANSYLTSTLASAQCRAKAVFQLMFVD